MSGRLRSGNDHLDEVLGGGLPANGISLITGLPGAGKTIVAQQYVFRNASPDRPAIYLSTVSEPLEKILRFGQTLDFFDRAVIGRSVFYEDLGMTVNRTGLPGVLDQVGNLLRDRRPGMVVIDSFKALQAFASGPGEFRRFLHDLTGRLTAVPAASLWVGEYGESEIAAMPEFAVADAIMNLAAARIGQREMRLLSISKLRGSGFLPGRHAYRLSRQGMQVFPRLADTLPQAEYTLGDVRVSSGIVALDEMIADGYWPGAATLVAGPSGSGKTVMGLHFIFGGARRGEPGVIATLQENPSQLHRMARGFGWSLGEPQVELMYRSAVDIYIDEWVYELLELVERTKARRVLVDSLMDLQMASADETRFREFVYSLTQRFSRQGVSLLMTMETADLFETRRLSDSAISHLSDNVIMLSHYRDQESLKRSMAVLKTRASQHDESVRQFLIGPAGITLADPVPPRGELRTGDGDADLRAGV
jgi:circadian clock protein KaiC